MKVKGLCQFAQRGLSAVRLRRLTLCGSACFYGSVLLGAEPQQPEAKVTDYHGRVRWVHDQFDDAVTQTNLSLRVGNAVHTLEDSMAVVWFRNNDCSCKLGESSYLRIGPTPADASPLLRLVQGALYFFSRERTREAQIWTPHATGAPRGTEFVVTVQADRTILAVLNGTATLANNFGTTNLQSGEMGVAVDGSPPIRLRLEATNIVQWWLYYPGVLDPDELGLSTAEKEAWAPSLNAYGRGDLTGALLTVPAYPAPTTPQTDALRTYLASLYLAAGQVQKTESLLEPVSPQSSTAAALRWVMAAVQLKLEKEPGVAGSASEWLGLSYYYQARNEPQRLGKALWAATNAVAKSPGFAFAWERVAELEFGFGHTARAEAALAKSLELASANAQAHALRGFLFSAQNRLGSAGQAFERSIELDSSLGNAWLGRGLVKIRTGHGEEGRMDLQTGVVLEPNRSLLRSYLAKAYADVGSEQKAEQELRRAIDLDSKDPTPWLYSALLKQQENRINKAVEDLETSEILNQNRQIYRSQLLLDSDRAVQGANLARIYADAGMTEPSVWEAGKSVNSDYANASAHLFLADSFDAIRDPRRITLRYERPWLNELLMANLLAPVGAGSLSQNVSQQEYSKLFERDGPRLNGSVSYLSNGELDSSLSQFGTFGNTSYALDFLYLSQDGYRANEDFRYTSLDARLKHQLSDQDTIYLQVEGYDYDAGDVFQRYNQASYSPHRRVTEDLGPTTLLGYRRDWSPESHSLLLAGYLTYEMKLTEPDQPSFIQFATRSNPVYEPIIIDSDYHSRYRLFISELQQIWQRSPFTTIFGAACQAGTMHVQNNLTLYPRDTGLFQAPGMSTDVTPDFLRLSAYVYENFQLLENLVLSAGVSCDYQSIPANTYFPPVSGKTEHVSQLSPKIGLTWNPDAQTTLRASYTRSLGGFSVDQNYRLEPTQIAGFNQAFYHLIPELISGPTGSPKYDTLGAGFDHRFPTRTYVGATAEYLKANEFEGNGALLQQVPNGIGSTLFHRDLTFHETDFLGTVHQLLSQQWALGTTFRWSRVRFEAPVHENPRETDREEGTLEELSLYALWNHPSGLFAKGQAVWYHQESHGLGYLFEGDNFWQANVYFGYRFLRRRAEVQLALLNLTDQNYHLNPLNLYPELPRGRTVGVSLIFNF